MKHNYKRITALAGMTALLVSMPVSVYAGQIRNTYTANLSNVLGSVDVSALKGNPVVKGSNIVGKLRDVDGWLRNRLRYCIWTDWKKPERKRKNLLRLGVDADHAYAWSRTRKGGWRIAQSPILTTTITVKRLKQKGYIPMLEIYRKLNPSVYEPPYTRPVRTVV